MSSIVKILTGLDCELWIDQIKISSISYLYPPNKLLWGINFNYGYTDYDSELNESTSIIRNTYQQTIFIEKYVPTIVCPDERSNRILSPVFYWRRPKAQCH